MNLIKLAMALLLAALMLYIAISLVRRSRSSASALNLEDLLLGDDGKISKAAAVMMGAFAMTTWLMVYLALNNKMTEGYLAIYVGAWIAPTVMRLIVSRPAETVATLEPSTTSVSKTIAPGASP